MPRPPALPPPTDAELDVLRVLWDRGASTVREVHTIIGKSKPIGYTTVLKQMQVMHRKGLLTRSERFTSHLYEAAQPQTETQRQLVGTLMKQAFDGSARGLLQSALSGRPVGREELAEIRKLLDEYERKRR